MQQPTKPKDLKVVNLWCGPGGGKSTTSAGLFNLLKSLGASVELVTEYAKDLTYERNYGSLQNQLLILAEQDRRLRRLVGQVDFAITDSPLPLGIVYMTPEYEDWLPDAAEAAYHRYTNYDFWVERVKPYQQYGRVQTASEALALDVEVRNVFHHCTAGESGRPEMAWVVRGDEFAPYDILEKLPVVGKERMLT